MAKLKVDIVSGERRVYSADDVDIVVAPGAEGQLGILPHHIPLLTTLAVGELKIRKGEAEEYFAIHGGFMEVRRNEVTVLADTAERAEEIDVARAEAAQERAERLLKEGPPREIDRAALEGALRRSRIRLEVARRRRRRRRPEELGEA